MNTTLISAYGLAVLPPAAFSSPSNANGQSLNADSWLRHLENSFPADREISLSIQLPADETRATAFGSNPHRSPDPAAEASYLLNLLQEWRMYRRAMPSRPVLRQLHLGGGISSFHSAPLRRFLEAVFQEVEVPLGPDYSFDAHACRTNGELLRTLHDLRFRRIGLTLADPSMPLTGPAVDLEAVAAGTRQARETGYRSVSYRLAYGLPYQEERHILRLVDFVEELRPDRLSFSAPGATPFNARTEAEEEAVLTRQRLYRVGRERFSALGYREIGMDQFALPGDALCRAMDQGLLHHNAIGYGYARTRLALGLGAAAIGDTWIAVAQNEKTAGTYQRTIAEGRLPVAQGRFLRPEDRMLRAHRLNLMTRFETNWFWPEEHNDALLERIDRLQPMAEKGLVELEPFRLRITASGRPFLREICEMIGG
jgi:oxygen-independent coproporphyrinogen-3 oxidase